MDKIQLIGKLVAIREKEQAALDVFPNVFQSALLDCEFVDALCDQIRVLMDAVFSENEMEDINWFFYEWRPGFSVVVDGKEWVINNFHEFLEYFSAQHCQQ